MTSTDGSTRCAVCGGDNACGMARGADTCWCASISIPAAVLARVPLEQRNRVCVCQRCAAGDRDPAEVRIAAARTAAHK